jgi:hypothetical protein
MPRTPNFAKLIMRFLDGEDISSQAFGQTFKKAKVKYVSLEFIETASDVYALTNLTMLSDDTATLERYSRKEIHLRKDFEYTASFNGLHRQPLIEDTVLQKVDKRNKLKFLPIKEAANYIAYTEFGLTFQEIADIDGRPFQTIYRRILKIAKAMYLKPGMLDIPEYCYGYGKTFARMGKLNDEQRELVEAQKTYNVRTDFDKDQRKSIEGKIMKKITDSRRFHMPNHLYNALSRKEELQLNWGNK